MVELHHEKKEEEKLGDEKQIQGWQIRQRMDLREVTLFLKGSFEDPAEAEARTRDRYG